MDKTIWNRPTGIQTIRGVQEIHRVNPRTESQESDRAFDEVPAASASLAQVHFAVLPTGEEVAVKVQRPDVRERITDDLDALDSLLRFVAWIAAGLVKRSNLRATFDEFKRYTLQELDFVMEARTMERFAENFEEWEDVVIPKVHWTHTSPRVLTMQRVSGMRLAEAVNVLPLDRREKLAKRSMEMMIRMFISDGFFHADLHPGNILFREDGSMVLLDFGMFGELSEEFFRSHGMQKLCRETWCELDFPLAEKWGGELERTTTLAEGASRCDFRWKTAPVLS